MEATTARPTLLSAARNFIRKSAGPAVLAIAPLAAITVAPEAKAQVTLSPPNVSLSVSGAGSPYYVGFYMSGGSFFSSPGSTSNNLRALTFGGSGTINSSGGSGGAVNTLVFSGNIAGSGTVSMGTIIPIAYNFTLDNSSLAGTPTVNWEILAGIGANNYTSIGSGSLLTGSQTFSDTANYTADLNAITPSNTYFVTLVLTYQTQAGDSLQITMNPGTQGFTINAAAIPEPSTYAALFGLGALGFVIVRRSRRAVAA